MGNPNIIREFPWEVLRNQWMVPNEIRYERSEQETDGETTQTNATVSYHTKGIASTF